jgi:hypothetical protein
MPLMQWNAHFVTDTGKGIPEVVNRPGTGSTFTATLPITSPVTWADSK